MKQARIQEQPNKDVIITDKLSEAIEKAKLNIMEHQRNIRRLHKAIKVFRQNMETGEPWPGETR